MVFTTSKLLVLVAVICAVVALIAVVFEVNDPKVYPGAMAASLLFGWASFLVP